MVSTSPIITAYQNDNLGFHPKLQNDGFSVRAHYFANTHFLGTGMQHWRSPAVYNLMKRSAV